ncbi:pyrimidodiazepine synthase-like isoform X2 [Panulirus ornatus]|uniref:pyrimidodiazepine synthase-like isoform X2 n=1 Tax=Panulirus ornatus TaxID=150431 RepID=UPI003A88BF8F
MANKNTISSLITMTTKHLGPGSVCPPLDEGVLRCYSMKYCPYAQRTHLVLAVKKIKHEVVYINLKTKPEWYFDKNPLGKVPALEQNGKVIFESLVTCDYLDEVYPEPSLYPADPWKKAQDQNFIELWSKITTALYKLWFSKGDEQIISRACDDLKAGLDVFEKELSRRNTTFFSGEKPGMLDYMIWPWAERLPVAQQMIGDICAMTPDRCPKMMSWMDNMMQDSSVKATYLLPEVHSKFLATFDPDDTRFKSSL